MNLDRGTLANIDRKVLSGLRRQEHSRMVRLPISDALWSTWRRYCDAIGMPMGRAVVALIVRELGGVVDEHGNTKAPTLAGRVAEEMATREARVESRERDVAAADRRLRQRDQQLRAREADLLAREHRLEVASRVARRQEPSRKVGRNERCPCGSGRKYKHCHAR